MMSIFQVTESHETVVRALHTIEGALDLSETPWEISTLSDGQEKILSLLPIMSGLLSISGSATIIYMTSRRGGKNEHQRKRKKWTPYTRLLFGMSCCDIVGSVTLILTPFLLPAKTSQRVWSLGNDATCSVLGFLYQLSLSGMLYNAFLSFYFVLTARYGWKNKQFARTMEPAFHIVSIGYPLATATAGSIMDIYHEMELGQMCWITNYPENCEQDEAADVDCQGFQIAWIFRGTILLFTIFSIPINNMIIFMFVRKQTTRSGGQRRRRSGKKSVDSTILASERSKGSAKEVPSSKTSTSIARDSGIEVEPDSLSTGSEEYENRALEGKGFDGSTRRQEEQLRRLQLIASLAFLYVGAFFLSTTWSFVLRVMESISYNAT
jgi:hypothetical protein